jgi:hypothetical protein
MLVIYIRFSLDLKNVMFYIYVKIVKILQTFIDNLHTHTEILTNV